VRVYQEATGASQGRARRTVKKLTRLIHHD